MVIVNENGCRFYIDGYLKRSLDTAKHRVIKRKWDYVCIVAGIPGSGKSTLARTIARYVDPNFTAEQMAFRADGEWGGFIPISNSVPENSAVVLDESFQALNTRVAMTPDFLKIINHLQLIRQKNLFIILCLPNFFDLSKTIAVFRASHLFVTYASEDGRRGSFMAFDRGAKRKLYVRGSRYLDYNAYPANYVANFRRNREIGPEDVYEKFKQKHLVEQEKKLTQATPQSEKDMRRLIQMVGYMRHHKRSFAEIEQLTGIPKTTARYLSDQYNKMQKIPQVMVEMPENELKNNQNTDLHTPGKKIAVPAV